MNYELTQGQYADFLNSLSNTQSSLGIVPTTGSGAPWGGTATLAGPMRRNVPAILQVYRRFGAWAGGVRPEAYGQRFVRTAR